MRLRLGSAAAVALESQGGDVPDPGSCQPAWGHACRGPGRAARQIHQRLRRNPQHRAGAIVKASASAGGVTAHRCQGSRTDRTGTGRSGHPGLQAQRSRADPACRRDWGGSCSGGWLLGSFLTWVLVGRALSALGGARDGAVRGGPARGGPVRRWPRLGGSPVRRWPRLGGSPVRRWPRLGAAPSADGRASADGAPAPADGEYTWVGSIARGSGFGSPAVVRALNQCSSLP